MAPNSQPVRRPYRELPHVVALQRPRRRLGDDQVTGPQLVQAFTALSQVVGDERRTRVFAWYALLGSFGTAAFGAVFAAVILAKPAREFWAERSSRAIALKRVASASVGEDSDTVRTST